MVLEKLPNIGKILAARLEKIGINSAKELQATGSRNAILKITTELNDGCIDTLYALEGALQGVRWHSISKEDKADLKKFYDSIVIK